MIKCCFSIFWILVISWANFVVSTSNQQRKVYIVYMGSLPEGEYSPSAHHSDLINQVVDPRYANKSIIRSYTKSFNGFAAYLTLEEQEKLASYDEVISVFPSQKARPQTTRSWDFMGLPTKAERRPTVESDIIIGIIDYGIWPESESFNDEGFGPIPKKWRGVCDGGINFTCNKKIIGARSYVFSFDAMEFSARDVNGHGTHVASIAAGNEVIGANFYGLAQGIARGGVPSARIAVYKVCGLVSCNDNDIMSAFDDAIADGVDIISVSLGHKHPMELISDPYAIGSFHAMEKDILTVHSAGNNGPRIHSVIDYVPWIFTVAASYTDRRIVDKILLGDGTILVGDSVNAFPSTIAEVPIVYGKEVTRNCSEAEAKSCLPNCLQSSIVKQKVVLCDTDVFNMEFEVPEALGYITPFSDNTSDVMPLPAIVLGTNDINFVKTYKMSARKPTARIFKSAEIHNPAALLIAPFSSRGPTRSIPDIIKPDITAPGVEIIAAYSPLGSPSLPYDQRRVKYNIMSGTSMACPHVTAAAAYVKSFHPNWSPSAVKSALMTTAREMNGALNTDAEFAYGSGHIDPIKATDPGLVYETFLEDYRKIWCNMPRSNEDWTMVNANCRVKLSHKELNYPSMAAQVDTNSAFTVIFPRTVTNVGPAHSIYTASVSESAKLKVFVEPNTLQFTAVNQKMSFNVTVRGKIKSPRTIKSVALIWTDSIHRVRSPIVVYTMNATSLGEAPSTPPMFRSISLIVLVMFLL